MNELLIATKMLLANKDIPKYFEWKSVLDMLELTSNHIEKMLDKKNRVDLVADIFELIKVPITFGLFPDYLLS
jgi:hypothetical protein